MVKAFSWNLHDMDDTDIESLLPFVYRWTETEAGEKRAVKTRRMYCDEVSWL